MSDDRDELLDELRQNAEWLRKAGAGAAPTFDLLAKSFDRAANALRAAWIGVNTMSVKLFEHAKTEVAEREKIESALRAEVEAHAETTTLHVQTRAALDEAVRHLATAQAALEATNRQIVIMRAELAEAREHLKECRRWVPTGELLDEIAYDGIVDEEETAECKEALVPIDAYLAALSPPPPQPETKEPA